MNNRFAAVHAQIKAFDANLQRKIIQQSLNDRIWMLLLTGTVLAVMAHGFKWI